MKKTSKVLTVIISALIMTSSVAGCGCENKNAKKATDDEAAVVASTSSTIPSAAQDKAEQAIADNDASVNEKVVEKDNKAAVTADDGNKDEADPKKDKETVDKTTNSGSETSNRTANNSNTNSSDTTNNNSNKTTNTTKSNSNNNTSNKSSNTQSAKTQPAATSADPHAGKTWHEAVYKTVNHPAETKKVWVVDQEAYTYEEPIYEWQTICNVCGANITNNLNPHMKAHAIAHEGGRYHDDYVQVDTKTVSVPEQGHYETQTVKSAWTEQVIVKEAGWY